MSKKVFSSDCRIMTSEGGIIMDLDSQMQQFLIISLINELITKGIIEDKKFYDSVVDLAEELGIDREVAAEYLGVD